MPESVEIRLGLSYTRAVYIIVSVCDVLDPFHSAHDAKAYIPTLFLYSPEYYK